LGYGGVVQDPGGAIWKVATSSKKDTGPATREIDGLVLLLGVENVKATKRFYLDRGLAVAKSFGSKYVEFAPRPLSSAEGAHVQGIAGAVRRAGSGRMIRGSRHRRRLAPSWARMCGGSLSARLLAVPYLSGP
jgi:hypothetical protein